jgi:hypothetical protein
MSGVDHTAGDPDVSAIHVKRVVGCWRLTRRTVTAGYARCVVTGCSDWSARQCRFGTPRRCDPGSGVVLVVAVAGCARGAR